jgi:hypothetical protein
MLSIYPEYMIKILQKEFSNVSYVDDYLDNDCTFYIKK